MARRILIVDDSPESIALLTTVLSTYLGDVDIRSATRGEEALAIIRNHDQDLILLDAVMPGINGFEVCRELKQDEATAHMPVLMISGVLVEREHRISGMECGAEGYLCKPFERDELLAQVRSLLNMKAYQDRLAEQEARLEERLAEQTENLLRSERYLNDIFQNSVDAIFVEDIHGNVLDCNKAASKLHEMPREELIGKNVLDLVPENERAHVASAFPDWSAGMQSCEGWIYTASGRRIPVEIRRSRVHFDGQDELMFHVRDISERRAAEDTLAAYQQKLEALVEQRTAALSSSKEQLKQSRADFHSIVEKSMEGVLVLNEAGTVQYANPAAAHLLETALDELVGFPFDYLVGIGEELEIETDRPDGTRRTIEALNSETEWHGLHARLVILRDIGVRRSAESRLARSQHLESLGVVAGGIAHDFNNLLSGIVGNISYARLPDTRECQRNQALADAEGAAGRAKLLTQQLLTFAKGGTPIRKVADTAALIQDTTQFTLSGSNCAYEIEASPDLWATFIDVSQIGQVIENLVLNAAQAMPRGGTVHISARNVCVPAEDRPVPQRIKDGNYVEIEIADSGVGISQEHLGKIFNPYFTTKENGSGLGLAICYSIVSKHDGEIVVASEPGVGSVFTLYLPATPKTEFAVTAQPESPLASNGNGKRILVMDDEDIIRNLVTRILESIGYESLCVEDGQAAINAFRAAQAVGNPFDAVILDLTIPGGMGGEETLAELYKLDPNVKALVSSGYSANAVFSEYRDHGFAGVIPKPYNVLELAQALANVTA